MQNGEYVSILVKMLEERSFYLRYNAIKLIRIISTNSTACMQTSISNTHHGIAQYGVNGISVRYLKLLTSHSILELLEERREMIRNG